MKMSRRLSNRVDLFNLSPFLIGVVKDSNGILKEKFVNHVTHVTYVTQVKMLG